ncbi:MAG: glutathione S-transferase C-terminal domain-containing protein [Rhodanobacteraceae bacterium]
MDLYFAPLACSMASRIALYEAGATANYVYVDIHTDPHARRLADGSDYYAINPMGQVPAIRTDEGELITENPVVLQWVADHHPTSKLAPPSGPPRYKLQQWLNFIGTELHKATYIPLLSRTSPEGAKEFARQKLQLRMTYLGRALDSGEYLPRRFSVADCYLVTVLNWSAFVGLDLTRWPAVSEYYDRVRRRPCVAKALTEEKAIFGEEQERARPATV